VTDPSVSFGTLVDIEARSAWGHEAHDFTPWLADNLDRLSNALGIPLELTGREVRNGRYSADILATNPADGSVVLIENQLEASDHTHLGQVMTYLAGLDAHVVVWLAPNFREEHLSAIRWLNQHTDETFSFFAVKLRVVQIADSPLAPLFEVLEKPNSWDKQLQSKARAVRSSVSGEAAERRELFWPAYAEIDPRVESDLKAGAGGGTRWRPVREAGVVISRYVSDYGVGLFIRGERGKGGEITLPRLEAAAVGLTAELGPELGDANFPFLANREVDWSNPADIEAAAAWLAQQTNKYEVAAQRHLALEEQA